MHIAVLVTNTDDSPFASGHPNDAEKFRAFLQPRRPGWQISTFDLPSGEFPADLSAYDGFIIGGSPASVNDDAAWIGRLMEGVRAIVAQGVPLFGACFGHQAIAVALGGKVTRNPGGWVFGVTSTQTKDPAPWMADATAPIRVNAAHSEQVTELPPGAQVIGGNAECPHGSFRIGTRVFTTQYHPEMSQAFMAALVEEYGPKLPPEVARAARASVAQPAEIDRMANWIVGFFEQAEDRA
ncbi:MAG: type 1 glutamine amidotransferase [Cypionkella sp.]